MTVRLATPEDAERIAEIHVAAWRCAYVPFMPKGFLDSLSVEERASMWRKTLSWPGPGVYTVSIDSAGEVVAFCAYGPSRDADASGAKIGELIAINVLPSEWSKGYGKELCDAVLVHARLSGWQAVTLWVLHGNGRARTFYEKSGFVADGAERQDAKLIGVPLHEVRYRKVIGSRTDNN